MRMLFVTTTVPFPPRQGVELNNAHIIEKFATQYELDLLILTPQESQELNSRKMNIPSTIKQVYSLYLRPTSFLKKLIAELLGRSPTFFTRGFSEQKVLETLRECQYDLVWVAPVGGLGLLNYCETLGLKLAPLLAIGCNDIYTTLYLDSFRELLSCRMGWDSRRFLRGLRVPFLWLHEKQYLRTADIIHLQTPAEKKRAEMLLGKKVPLPKLMVASSGRKIELDRVSYKGHNSQNILYMTHLNGGRARESRWFLTQVWPRIYRQNSQATLLLVGTPPEPGSRIAQSLPEGVQVLGYVNDLVELYNSVSIAVVPILHRTGLVTRVLDAITAGVPLVASPQALSTLPGLIPNQHALSADTAQEFANKILELLSKPELRFSLSRAGRSLAQLQPTWEQTTEQIAHSIHDLYQNYKTKQALSGLIC